MKNIPVYVFVFSVAEYNVVRTALFSYLHTERNLSSPGSSQLKEAQKAYDLLSASAAHLLFIDQE